MPKMDGDVVVIGLGAWGSAALWQLAERGVNVTGIERYAIGHALGSSHGGTRMFRVTCLEHPGLVPLARRSGELWRELSMRSGEDLLLPTGGLLVGAPGGAIAGGTLRAAAAHGVDVRVLSAAQLQADFPQHARVPSSHIGVLEPSAGLIRPEASISAAVTLAKQAGAVVMTGTSVQRVSPSKAAVEVETGARTLRFQQAVIAVGAWLPLLVPGLPLETIRMPITWFRPRAAPERFSTRRFPVFMRELSNGQVLWGSGNDDDGNLVKLGLECLTASMRSMDPDSTDRSVGPEDWTELGQTLDKCLPDLGTVPERVAVCMFSRTPDGQFIIGRHPDYASVLLAGGCNAHGGKHALGIGEALANMATGGDTRVSLGFTEPGRFDHR